MDGDLRLRVLVTDHAWPTLDVERAELSACGAELVVARRGDVGELRELATGCDAILTCWKDLPAEVLEVASRCVHVSRYGIGVDNIDVVAATRLGIIVTNVPDYCVEEVADHVMALLLACARRVVHYARETSLGRWDGGGAEALPRLRGQTLGLVGFGNIARRVVPRAHGFGLEVVAHTPRLTPDQVPAGVRVAKDLDELLEISDYVSLHAPLHAATRSLIDGEALARMRSSAYLINTARGALVDEIALVGALRRGDIAGAAIDVLDEEPPATDHPLLALGSVVASPHIAYCSDRSVAELQRRAASHVARSLAGETPPHVVNRQVLESPALRLRSGGVR